MNRRQFIAGLAASTAPMIGVGTVPLWPVLSDVCVPLPYQDPSAVFEQFWANELGRPLRETLHGVS